MNFKTLGTALALFAIPALALAQQGDPVEAANTVDACNGNAVISAVWQDDGRLAVTCPRGSVVGAAAAGAGATNFALPLLLVLVAGAAAIGGGGSTSSTN